MKSSFSNTASMEYLSRRFRTRTRSCKALNELSAPYVLVNRKARGARNWVVIDDRGAAEYAISYLIGRGHKRIAYLSGDLERYNSRERYAGYRSGLEKDGLVFDESLVSQAGYSVAEGRLAMRNLLDRAEGGGQCSVRGDSARSRRRNERVARIRTKNI